MRRGPLRDRRVRDRRCRHRHARRSATSCCARRRGRSSYHVLLSHVHWDHIQGLPFFSPAYIPGTRISVYALLTAADELQQVIGGITRHEFFPMPLEAVPGAVRLPPGRARRRVRPRRRSTSRRSRSTIRSARSAIASTAMARRGRTSPTPRRSIRCSTSSTSCRDPSRCRPTTGPRSARCARRSCARLAGVDTVVYDTHFLPEEYARFPHYGHSTPDQALEICAEAKVRRLVLYHHAPSHGDEQMDQIAADVPREGRGGRHRGADLVRGHDAADRLGPIRAEPERQPGSARREDPVLGRARLVRDVGPRLPALRRQHDLGRARHRRGRAAADRSRHRRDRARQAR